LILFAIRALQRRNPVLGSAKSPTASLVDHECASANGRTRDQKLAQFCNGPWLGSVLMKRQKYRQVWPWENSPPPLPGTSCCFFPASCRRCAAVDWELRGRLAKDEAIAANTLRSVAFSEDNAQSGNCRRGLAQTS